MTTKTLEGFVPYPAQVAEDYRRKGYWKGRTLGEHFDDWVARGGERVAVVAGDERISYRELGKRVACLASHLAALGIRPRDRVLMQLNNVPEFLYLAFALFKLGALPVMALPAHRETEIRYLIEFSGAVAYAGPLEFRGFNYVDMVRKIAPGAPGLKHLIIAGNDVPKGAIAIGPMLSHADAAGASIVARNRPSPSDVAFFLLSGGTTGLPKLIPRTHDDYFYNFDISADV